MSGIYFRKYYDHHFYHILTSKFNFSSPDKRLVLNRVKYELSSSKHPYFSFLYLWRFTSRLPKIIQSNNKTRIDWESIKMGKSVHSISDNYYIIRNTVVNRQLYFSLSLLLSSIIRWEARCETRVFRQHVGIGGFTLYIREDLPIDRPYIGIALTRLLNSSSAYLKAPFSVSLLFDYASIFQQLYFLQCLRFVRRYNIPGIVNDASNPSYFAPHVISYILKNNRHNHV